MAVIAFTSFIVVSHDTASVDHICQAIFEVMLTTSYGLLQTPDNHFNKGRIVESKTFGEEQFRGHVENDANNASCCQ